MTSKNELLALLRLVLYYIIMSRLDITRSRNGRYFAYFKGDVQLKDKATLERIRAMRIPPAWSNVAIASSENAKVLAQGTDKAGRPQSIYNPKFRAKQDKLKHQRIVEFASRLPDLRKQVEGDLAKPGLPKEKVMACIVKLIDVAYFRVGNEEYAEENNSYGITTMRSKHIDYTNYSVTFDFMGKSGKHHVKKINDQRISKIIKQLDEMPGYEIFRYRDVQGDLHNVSSQNVNEYIKEYMGGDFTAKDFRTWGGTLLAIDLLTAEEKKRSESERKKYITVCVKQVSQRLGNTPAIARASYINPRVVARYIKGEDFFALKQSIDGVSAQKHLSPNEYCALKILEAK
jgi:DNA topoisomerase-1